MYKVTRLFIEKRKEFCKYPVEVVSVSYIGGGKLNDCYGNAHRLRESSDNYRIISGWCVMPYNKIEDATQVIQHWWNIDITTRKHIDTSPVEAGAEYVIDMDLYTYCFENDEKLSTHVATSLIYEDDRFKFLTQIDDKFKVTDFCDLSTEALYLFEQHN